VGLPAEAADLPAAVVVVEAATIVEGDPVGESPYLRRKNRQQKLRWFPRNCLSYIHRFCQCGLRHR